MTGRLDLTVYDKAYVRKGPVGKVQKMSGELVFNGPGSCEFTISADNRRAADLTTSGARVVLSHRPDGGARRAIMSGRVDKVGMGGSRFAPFRTFRLIDDWTVLSDEVECWPNPTGTVSQQGDEDAYFKRTGPAETVLKQILAPNVTRQSTVLTIPTTAGLGSTITGSVRFHTIAERIMPLVEAAGLGVRVIQDGATRRLEVYVPTVRPQVLTQESGVIAAGEAEFTAATVTRVTLLAGGEGTARVVRQKINAALEASLGVKLPRTIDARDIQQDMTTDPTGTAYEAELTARMDEALAEGAPKASMSAVLAEAGWFRFGNAYDVGTRVRLKLAKAPAIEETIRRVAFSATPEDGVRFTPIAGEWADTSDAALIKHVTALTRAVGDLEKR